MPLRRPLLLCSVLALALLSPWAQAAKDDRNKPLNLVFDREGAIDKVKQRSEFNGNVILTKGSMVLRAERMDVQETADGYYQAYANGNTGKQVQFKQDRDTPGERIEGRADQIEYDTRSETIRLVGNAEARIMQGDQLKQALSGATLNYDNRTERLVVETGAGSPHPSGRGRVVLMPRNAASEPLPASSAPLPLRPSINLTPRQTPQ
ncbi:lipopolysaccharide transport periplasmic protein LptA [Roseateles chitosanitabidus]|jgi:lipopolysaccharide export system protein LptA|uniref:lipopolysaccharide transport periplasmic protein LptA n=1 Tax=Roseateles chitosanitabidus TaxID=65048 RepID=UPI00082F18A3|nr:lipopolysaccharide transport periplasmic protein LptA [Roseateles chitosanitabidus]MBO9686624.1 lipopolysaccharide transport periplasmic protein LptA [Roseateles chitosanitabidus]